MITLKVDGGSAVKMRVLSDPITRLGVTEAVLVHDAAGFPITGTANASGGKNVQALWSADRNTTQASDVDILSAITVTKTGMYTVRWVMSRNNNNADVWTALYINGERYGDRIQFSSGDSMVVFNRLALPVFEDVPLTVGDVLTVRGAYVSSVATTYAANLVIEEQ